MVIFCAVDGTMPETNPVIFRWAPGVVALTALIVIVHVPPAAIFTPLILMAVTPAERGGLNIGLVRQPADGVAVTGVPVSSRPAGRVSLTDTLLSCVLVFGLVRLMTRLELLPTAISGLLKLFVMVGGRGVPHPVMRMLSRARAEPVFSVLAPYAFILK